jgi:2'-5' RNA ligase
MIRLFYGLALPSAVIETLTAHQNGLPGVRWIAPDALHLTLRFVDSIDEGLAEELDHTMAERLARRPHPPLDIRVKGLGLFGDGHRKRTLWAGVEPSAPLLALQRTVETVCQHVGLKPEGRVYSPHITLGKVVECDYTQVVTDAVAPMVDQPDLLFSVEELSLFSSHLRPDGAQYQVVATIPLTAPAGAPTP